MATKAELKFFDTLASAFLSGTVTRNNISADDWNKLMSFAAGFTGYNAYEYGTDPQPLLLIRAAYEKQGMGDVFKRNFKQGIQAGVWQVDSTKQAGYVYNTAYGQPGSGAQGQPAAGTTGAPGTGGLPPGTPPPPSGTGGGSTPRAGFENLLMSWGIPVDDNLNALIQKAHNQGWSATQFQNRLYDTPEFHQNFPGIFAGDGTLKMSPQQYLSNVQQYNDAAAKYGINLNDQKTAYLFRNNVSPSEFADRSQALTMLRTNQQYLNAFNEQLKRMGQQPLTKAEQFKFVMGEGNQEWYDLYQQTNTRYSAEEAGIAFGKTAQAYTNLSQKEVQEVAGKNLTMDQLQQGFAKLAQDLTTTLPLSKIQKFDISKSDLVELEFGGPHQAAIAKKVQQVLANEKMFQTNQVAQRTGGQFTSGTRGQTGESGGF